MGQENISGKKPPNPHKILCGFKEKLHAKELEMIVISVGTAPE